MKGPQEPQEPGIGELTKKPEAPKPSDEGWVTIKPGLQQHPDGRLRTVETWEQRRRWL